MKQLLIIFVLLTTWFYNYASQPVVPDSCNSLHKKWVYYGTLSGIYSTTMSGLWHLWYSEHNTSKFHWFNDGNEWLKMDKAGHSFGSYHFQELSFQGLLYAGYSEKRAMIESALSSWAAFASLETFDALSDGWGASPYDLIANTLGISIFSFQQLYWHEQRIVPKFSYQTSKYAQYRPEALGNSHLEKLIKDYNGQTYWLSFNLRSLGAPGWWPSWLNIAAGYGATGMLGGEKNPSELNGTILPVYERKSQFYLSPDIDLRKIKNKNKWLKAMLYGLNMVKFPLPGIEYSNNKIKALWLAY